MKITKDALWDAWLAVHDPHHEDPLAQKAWETEASQVFDAYFARMTARALRPFRDLLSGPRRAADDECTITRGEVRDALEEALEAAGEHGVRADASDTRRVPMPGLPLELDIWYEPEGERGGDVADETADPLDLEAIRALAARECDLADRDLRKWVRYPVKHLRALLGSVERDTAPVVPDSADVRERVYRALYNASGARLMTHAERREMVLAQRDAVLAVMGQGVTAGCCDPSKVETRIEGTWLVDAHPHHTCDTGESGHYGAHEPGCGLVPVVDLRGLPGWDDLRAAVRQDVTAKRTITLPRPVVPHGPVGLAENEATANYLWEAARRIGDARMFGSRLTETVSDLLAAASHAGREDKPVDDGRPAADTIEKEAGDE